MTQVRAYNDKSDSNEQWVPSMTATAPTDKAARHESDDYRETWQLMLRLAVDNPATKE